MEAPTPKRVRTIGTKMAVAAALLAIVGVGLAYTATADPFVGFTLYALALLVSLAGTFMGLIGLLRGRGNAASLLAPAAVFVALLSPGLGSRDVPRINDITTDMTNPPVFVAATKHGPNQGRDMAYPGAEFADQQAAAYADLAPKRVELSVQDAMDRLRSAIESLENAQVVAFVPEQGRIEATQTSGIFRFVDDIVVRVKPDGSGSLVDIRSKSRDGQSDLGVNAARIRTLLGALDS